VKDRKKISGKSKGDTVMASFVASLQLEWPDFDEDDITEDVEAEGPQLPPWISDQISNMLLPEGYDLIIVVACRDCLSSKAYDLALQAKGAHSLYPIMRRKPLRQ